jgi:hypothetical protein
MSQRLRDACGWTALAVASAACGPSASQAASNTRADSAHLAAQATEPRAGDPTASQAPPPSPIPDPSVSVGGSTSAPVPPAPSAAAAASRRTPVAPAAISARHVLIQWMGSERAGKSVLRSREQAMVLAQEVLSRARGGEDLGRLAVEYSDEPNAGARRGSLGRFGKGQMVAAFDDVAFSLEVGQLSGIVETPFGFHIIQRTP